MTGKSEVRSLIVLLVALFALAVPAAAAFPDHSAASATHHGSSLHAAASLALLENAPQPLIVMAIGAVIVGLTVLHRARRSGLGPDADRS